MATVSVKGTSGSLYWGTQGVTTPDISQLWYSSFFTPDSVTFAANSVSLVESGTMVWDVGGSFTRAADGSITGTVTSMALSELNPMGGANFQLMNVTGLNTTYQTLIDIQQGLFSESVLLAGNDILNGAGFVPDPMSMPGVDPFILGVDLNGYAGNDTLTGTAYDDFLRGGLGNDQMTGGAGNDAYWVDSTLDVVTELASQGNDRVRSSISYTLGTNVEILSLSGIKHTNGTGNASANTITGQSGNNTLNGAGGADMLRGLGGNDILIGGAGVDNLTGGAGADKFDFNGIAESGIGLNRDVIMDFNRSQGDKVDLSTIDAKTAAGLANDAFSFITGTSFTAAGQVRYANGVIYGNTDADTQAEFEIGITLVGTASMAASDFIL